MDLNGQTGDTSLRCPSHLQPFQTGLTTWALEPQHDSQGQKANWTPTNKDSQKPERNQEGLGVPVAAKVLLVLLIDLPSFRQHQRQRQPLPPAPTSECPSLSEQLC